MNDELNVSSVNFSSIQDFPTQLSPISSNLNSTSYSFSMIITKIVITRPCVNRDVFHTPYLVIHWMCAIKTRSWEEGMSRYTVYHVCTGTWYIHDMIFSILVMTISKSLERTCCDDHFLSLVPRPFFETKKGLQGSICIIIITQDTLACTYLLLSSCSSTIVARGANYMQIALVRMRVRKI